MTELKPCPFCGGEAEYWIDDDYQDRHVITCGYCGCERRYEYSMDGVIEDWNTRHIPEGYALVPIYPTEEAMLAGSLAGRVSAHTAGKVFKAMIEAAQESP